MMIMQRNARYKALLILLYLVVPLFVLNLWIMEHGQILKLIDPKNIKWIVVITVITVVNFYALFKIKKIGFYMILTTSSFIFLMNLSKLVFEKNYALGFYALFILILSLVYLFQLYEELNSSFYQSGQRWFEGKPKVLAEIMIEFNTSSGKLKGGLSKLDAKGCFALFENDFDLEGSKKLDIKDSVLSIGNYQLPVEVSPMTFWFGVGKKVTGMGLKFEVKNTDEQKDLLDFLDRVRSYGYAL